METVSPGEGYIYTPLHCVTFSWGDNGEVRNELYSTLGNLLENMNWEIQFLRVMGKRTDLFLHVIKCEKNNHSLQIGEKLTIYLLDDISLN